MTATDRERAKDDDVAQGAATKAEPTPAFTATVHAFTYEYHLCLLFVRPWKMDR